MQPTKQSRKFTTDAHTTPLKRGDRVSTLRTGRTGTITDIFTVKANGATWHEIRVTTDGLVRDWDASDVFKR